MSQQVNVVNTNIKTDVSYLNMGTQWGAGQALSGFDMQNFRFISITQQLLNGNSSNFINVEVSVDGATFQSMHSIFAQPYNDGASTQYSLNVNLQNPPGRYIRLRNPLGVPLNLQGLLIVRRSQ